MTATDELRRMLDEREVEHYDGWSGETRYTKWKGNYGMWFLTHDSFGTNGELLYVQGINMTPEQAIAATLGTPKAKAHPYGYEPDTGAFDVTRCECGCLNDISATYRNDCGGEIEIDMNAEKEIYNCSRHLVFVEKHDDGSLEFGGKRYIAKGDA